MNGSESQKIVVSIAYHAEVLENNSVIELGRFSDITFPVSFSVLSLCKNTNVLVTGWGMSPGFPPLKENYMSYYCTIL